VNTIDRSKPYTITGAPRVVKGKVIIGNGGAELGVRGYVSAYDASTGKLAWRFYTVPGNPADGFEADSCEDGRQDLDGEWWKIGGGGTVWDSMAYDPSSTCCTSASATAAPGTTAFRSEGKGDNLFLSSIVALEPGRRRVQVALPDHAGRDLGLHRHAAHHPRRPRPSTAQPRKVLMQAPKNGFFYVIDAPPAS
jgi:quinohemoprotein ethanol dehydrogenase